MSDRIAANCRARASARGALLGASLLGVLACVREHTLFVGGAEAGAAGATGNSAWVSGGGAGAAGTTGAPEPLFAGAGGGAGAPSTRAPWDKASCVAALSAGKSLDACVGEFNCSATSDCCQVTVGCEGDLLAVAQTCELCPVACTVDSDCPQTQLCDDYQCRDCPSEPCPTSWTFVLRNGCSACVPPSECKNDKECGANLSCVAGLSCLPNCKADPNCCFGNRCASAACGPPDALDCLLVGCAAGSFCKWGSEAPECKCDAVNGKWICGASAGNVCVAR